MIVSGIWDVMVASGTSSVCTPTESMKSSESHSRACAEMAATTSERSLDFPLSEILRNPRKPSPKFNVCISPLPRRFSLTAAVRSRRVEIIEIEWRTASSKWKLCPKTISRMEVNR